MSLGHTVSPKAAKAAKPLKRAAAKTPKPKGAKPGTPKPRPPAAPTPIGPLRVTEPVNLKDPAVPRSALIGMHIDTALHSTRGFQTSVVYPNHTAKPSPATADRVVVFLGGADGHTVIDAW